MKRPEEIKTQYIQSIDKHLEDLLQNRVTEMFEIEKFSEILCIHPVHLSNTIKETTGTSACGILQIKTMERAIRLLKDESITIRSIALQLTFEPSQFTKWFKKILYLTPKEYRRQLAQSDRLLLDSEIMTILTKYADIPLSF